MANSDLAWDRKHPRAGLLTQCSLAAALPGEELICCVCRSEAVVPGNRLVSCEKCRHGKRATYLSCLVKLALGLPGCLEAFPPALVLCQVISSGLSSVPLIGPVCSSLKPCPLAAQGGAAMN